MIYVFPSIQNIWLYKETKVPQFKILAIQLAKPDVRKADKFENVFK